MLLSIIQISKYHLLNTQIVFRSRPIAYRVLQRSFHSRTALRADVKELPKEWCEMAKKEIGGKDISSLMWNTPEVTPLFLLHLRFQLDVIEYARVSR
jgi:hypothetical protein